VSTDPYRLVGLAIDMRDRFTIDTSVDASPADATETIIATVTLDEALRADQSVHLLGYAAFTVGTSGTSARLRIRRTNVSGDVKADTDATNATAAQKVERVVVGTDALGAVAGQIYVLTLTVGAASAASTVSNVALLAVVV
jgi:hypothetical protein